MPQKNSLVHVPTKKVIVIGAGIAGLATAALLAKEGYGVTLLEKNHMAGGRGITWGKKGFLFDMGPSWYLMPEVFERFFNTFNKTTADFYTLKRLDPSYRVFFEKDAVVDVPSNLEDSFKLFDSFEENGALKLKKYLAAAEYKYTIAMQDFLYKEYSSFFDFFTPRLLFEAPRLHLFDSVDTYARRFFASDKARKILEYSMVFLGGSPSNTPALYSLMSHVDLTLGVFYPNQGMWKIFAAVEDIAQKQGVRCIYNAPVSKIVIDKKTMCARGVRVGKKEYFADIVVSAADYWFTETQLLTKEAQTYSQTYWDMRVVAPSALLVYFGFNTKVKNLKHHNLFLAKEWNTHFKEIFDVPAWPKNPSFYVGCPSKTDATVAPKGCENVFVLVPLAAGINDTPKARKKLTAYVLSLLEEASGQKLAKHIVVQRTFAHKDFLSTYNSFKGSALGIAHTLFQTALFRPRHKSAKIKNLYYAGNYTHPGIGVPIALMSGEIVAKRIIKEKP